MGIAKVRGKANKKSGSELEKLWKNEEEKINCMETQGRDVMESCAVRRGLKLIQEVLRVQKRIQFKEGVE